MHISGLQDRRISLAFFSSLWVWVTSYSRQFLIATLRLGPIPDHVAFIMDGNRRYATENGISTAKGHFMGALAMEEVG
jgi:ditrans,polycis-polyprenyl diphosphate synthase